MSSPAARWLRRLSPSLCQHSKLGLRSHSVQHTAGLLQRELPEGMKEARSRFSLLRCEVVSKVFVSPCRMVTNRTINEALVRDPEECREAALRRSDPEKAFS